MNRAYPSIVYLGSATKGHKNNTPDTSAPLIELWQQLGYKVHFASNFRKSTIRFMHQLWTLVTKARHNPIVVIDTYSTRSFYGAMLLAVCCRLLGLIYMSIMHGGLLPKRLTSNARYIRTYFAKASLLVAPSAYLACYAEQQGWPVAIIPNGLNLADYPFTSRMTTRATSEIELENKSSLWPETQPQTRLDNELATTPDTDPMSGGEKPLTSSQKKQQIINPKILWLRAFDTIYRPELALEIFKLIQEQYPQAELYMVGPDKGGRMAACKNYAAQNHLKVHFPGKLSKREWKDIAQDCSIFLNTSSIDNAPVSVSEAMALGLVVVSANVGGMADLLDHGKAGFLIDEPIATEDSRATQSHVLAFSTVIIDLLEGRINAASQIHRARTLAEQQDWGTIQDLWTKVLTQTR